MARVFLIDATAADARSPFLSQPVGLLSIAAVLRAHGHAVAVHDCKLEVATLERRIREFGPDVLGLRSLTVLHHVLSAIAARARRAAPKALLVVGGPHATVNPHDALRQSRADVAVLGEGEITLLELLQALHDRPAWPRINGLAWLDDGSLVRSPARAPITDLDALPMPAWDLLPIELYFQLYHGGTAPAGRTLTLVTSRGCPYGCAFCHNIFGRRFRSRSAHAVLEEMDLLRRTWPIEEIEIHDDAFNLDKRRMLDICHGLQRRGSPLLLAFPNGLRADLLDREQVIELRLAGTRHVALSPETASPRLQEMLGKRMDLDKLAHVAACCDEVNVLTLGYFMLGFPTETEQEMLSTIDWACRSPLHTASFFVANALPGTRLFEIALAHGRISRHPDWSGYFQTDVNVSDVPDDRFRRLYADAYRRFYLHPRRLLSVWRSCSAKSIALRNGIFVAARMLQR